MKKIKIPWALVIIDAFLWLMKGLLTPLSKIKFIGVFFKPLSAIFSLGATVILIIILLKLFGPLLKKLFAKFKKRKTGGAVNVVDAPSYPAEVEYRNSTVSRSGYHVGEVNSFDGR